MERMSRLKKQTNCPNCGAPIDISRSSCEYCGTPYEKEVYLVEAPNDQELKTISYKADRETLTLLFAALFGVVVPIVLTAIVNFIF